MAAGDAFIKGYEVITAGSYFNVIPPGANDEIIVQVIKHGNNIEIWDYDGSVTQQLDEDLTGYGILALGATIRCTYTKYLKIKNVATSSHISRQSGSSTKCNDIKYCNIWISRTI
jgi:hypothetical protein